MIVRNFEYLLALHREGHFGRAASSCNVSQPTLSAGIKQLEEDMDVQIVRRGKQRYDGLTREGMRVLAWAQQMYEDCKGLERELSAFRKSVSGLFRIGVLPGVAAVIPILSVALAQKMPELEQTIVTEEAATLLSDLRNHKLDIVLGYLEDFAEEKLDTHLLYRERVFLFEAKSKAELRSISWEQVVQKPLCLLDGAVPQAAHAQLEPCAQTIATNSFEVLLAHLASGRYATVLPQSLAGRLMQIHPMQALAITGPGSQANVGFVASSHQMNSAPSRALLEMVHRPEVAAPIQAMLTAHRSLRPKLKSAPRPAVATEASGEPSHEG